VVRGCGDRGALNRPAVAIVGTRAASPRGVAVARRLAADLARAGWIVVSGLARGIDAAAHEGALDADGATVAIMATGVDRTYPAGHAALRRRIEGRGCVVTEAPDGTAPLPFLFPRRNRLVSGLARGVVVVEAPLRSGAMSTAYHGLDQGREVFAVPGPVDADACRGCHHLLRQGAHLAERAADVLEVLGHPPGAASGEAPVAALPVAGSAARWIWDRLDLTGLRLSELRARWTGTEEVWHEGLLALEMAGLIARLPGGGIARKIWIP
jgi:DNA processing protein